MKFAYLIEPPFNYRGQSNTITGCDVELAKYALNELGIKNPEFVEAEFAELLPGLALNKWQMTTGLFATEERQNSALFSRPIWALPDGLLVNVNDASNLVGYQSIAENSNHTLAVIRDQFQHYSALNFGVPEERIVIFETYKEAAQAVLEKRATAYASVARAHQGYLEQYPNSKLTVLTIPTSEKPPAFGCFGFAKADTELQLAVDEVLNEYLGSKQHRSMMNVFGFSDNDTDLLLHRSN